MMKTKLHLVLSFTILLSCFYTSAQEAYWKRQSEPANKSGLQLQRLDTKKVQFYNLDRAAFQKVLIDLNTKRRSFATIYFPDGKGTMIPFLVQEAPVMAPELTAKYPEIRSYKGRSLDKKYTHSL